MAWDPGDVSRWDPHKPYILNLFKVGQLTRVCLLLALFTGYCTAKRDHPTAITRAMYYWKSGFHVSPLETRYLHTAAVNTIYLRAFDVDRDAGTGTIVPVSVVHCSAATFSPALKYIPVVFLVNSVLVSKSLKPAELENLPGQIATKIGLLFAGFNLRYKEVQLDCDWTVGTRAAYFSLVDQLHTVLHKQNIQLSVTLRLHQLAYADRLGFPPCDRVMLMLYNTGSWKTLNDQNSIYEANITSHYLDFAAAYPLPMDLVIPILHWALVYRNNKFVTYYNYETRLGMSRCSFLGEEPTTAAGLSSSARNSVTFYRVKRDTLYNGFRLIKDDLIKAESVPPEKLEEIVSEMNYKRHNGNYSLAMFHLDSTLLTEYQPNEINKIFSAAR